jgi:hypothetical protein
MQVSEETQNIGIEFDIKTFVFSILNFGLSADSDSHEISIVYDYLIDWYEYLQELVGVRE